MPMGQIFPRVLTEVEVRGTVFDARYNREISGLCMIVIQYSTIGGVVVRLTHSRLVITFTAAGFWKRPRQSQSSPPYGMNDGASSRVLARQHFRHLTPRCGSTMADCSREDLSPQPIALHPIPNTVPIPQRRTICLRMWKKSTRGRSLVTFALAEFLLSQP